MRLSHNSHIWATVARLRDEADKLDGGEKNGNK